MTRRIALSLVAAALLPAGALVWMQPRAAARSPERVGVMAGDPAPTDAQLRARGPEGLRALLARYDELKDPALLDHIDAVAGQRDALWSRLYWYTDLEQAKAIARAEHKPILYLRLLGKLTDEYSCANSRFFRTVLYANEAVSRLLRDRFVLVWESERPVPVVTIDYGDGRVLKRTITGNSIHYILDPDGHVVDALPGLYDPVTFANALAAAIEPALSGSDAGRAAYQASTTAAIEQNMARDLAVIGKSKATAPSAVPVAPGVSGALETAASKRSVERPLVNAALPQPPAPAPRAADAAPRAISKGVVERPLVMNASDSFAAEPGVWLQMGNLHAPSVTLDEHSAALMRSQNPAYADDAVFHRAMEAFCRSIAQDTVRDQYDFRMQILGWLRQAPAIGLEELNKRVYSQLFLTPRSDPWLGLKSDDVYSALPDDGCSRK